MSEERKSQKSPQSWREKIRAAQDGVDVAYVYRARVFADAVAAGYTFRQVGEAAEMSGGNVHKIVGNGHSREVRSLDERAR